MLQFTHAYVAFCNGSEVGVTMSSSVQDMSNELRGVQGAWQGGPCPNCGEDVPANVVHCVNVKCRMLLNSELTEDSIEIPEFIPLPEIQEMKNARARGHYIRCGGCSEELRINAKYAGATVQCRHCDHTFEYTPVVERIAMYMNCPHCSEEIRASMKYAGQKVACRFCKGALQLEG
ncbi:hypothetical protein Fuma_06636 [Fuerstiella marisgermanici]|uniref:Uncharacterized protein n=2 Tax=Fuerstiella marisgermanici TaxID=1891926 RepID=A0A1P8WSD0_9PLAN|nr:hypothetical protein Fuma_06636 [Fuerstiella marisgermanici]